MSCIDEETLGAFVEGNLDAQRRGEVMEHLETCRPCTVAAGLARNRCAKKARRRNARARRGGSRQRRCWPRRCSAGVLRERISDRR